MIIEHDQAINILGSSDKIVIDEWTGLKAFIGEDLTKDENDEICLCAYDEINEESKLLMTNEQLAKSIYKIENNIISAHIGDECVFCGRVYIKPQSIDEIIG